MKAVRLHEYDKRPVVEDVPEPEATHPFDVVVRVGGAGLCRTDLHIVEGQWAAKSNVTLPYTLGHENAGWVHAVGSAVEHLQPGDAVILHPLVTCGFCRACRAGDDVHCEASAFPGIDTDGGMAELIKTSARSVVKLAPGVEPASVAALADAHGVPVVPHSAYFGPGLIASIHCIAAMPRESLVERYDADFAVNPLHDAILPDAWRKRLPRLAGRG